MKKVLITLFLILSVKSAKATTPAASRPDIPTLVESVSPSSTTCAGMTLSTVTVTNVIATTANLYHSIYVENEDLNSSVFCNESPTVTISGAGRGSKIVPSAGGTTPNNWKEWLIPYFENWYCISGSTSPTIGTSNIMVCKTQ